MSTSYVIPREIVGVTVHKRNSRWPRCGALRTHDLDMNLQWQRIERQRDQFDWEDWDNLVQACRLNSLVLIDTIIGTAGPYATSKHKDAYGFVGGASMPSDLAALERFVFARIRRANPRGKRRVVTIIEPWNEPWGFFEPVWTPQVCAEDKATPDWKPLVALERSIIAAAKFADPGIKAAMPSMLAGHPEHLAAYLKAGGGQHCDYANVHAYGHDLPAMVRTLREFRTVLDKAGFERMPIAFTECGHQPIWAPPFLKLSQAQQRREWADIMLYLASEGCPAFVSYSWDASGHAVDAGEVYPMAGKAWGEAPALVLKHIGKKIRKAANWSLTNRAWVIGGRTVRIA